MRTLVFAASSALLALSVASVPAHAQSSGRKAQERGMREIPRCVRPLGTIAMVEPDRHWWRDYNLSTPEAVLKVFVQKSGCFTLVNRGERTMRSRSMERALADSGELQRGSNMGKGQVRAADFLLEPDIVGANRNSGGTNVGGFVGGLLGGRAGAAIGGINMKRKEANVTLAMVNTRTTEELVVEGYARKTDIGFSGGAGAGWWGSFAAAGASGYQNTEIGQVIVLAYLDAYIKLVDELRR
jgi:curli biogenesis system outer membrane secretion channel CsgG